MAGPTDWRGLLTASQRYDNVQSIQQSLTSLGLAQSAFSIENEAYHSCRSREEYDAACAAANSALAEAEPVPPPDADADADSDRIVIGPYPDCSYVASGVTARVFRSGLRALKVIVDAGSHMEPHNPLREASILALLRPPCIPLLDTFRDREQRFVLVFPYLPLSLAALVEKQALPGERIRRIFADLLAALASLHALGIVHRDVKPSAVLLAAPDDGPAYLSDFGTAWHPDLSAATEPANNKILDIGTGPYRAPEVLFGDRSYGPPVDMWAVGAMLAECCTLSPLFESRPAHEDGSQLGLILSIFKTLGSPTRESWPEAAAFRTPPFDMYRVFEPRSWDAILPGVEPAWRDLVAALVRYDGERATAEGALQYPCIRGAPEDR